VHDALGNAKRKIAEMMKRGIPHIVTEVIDALIQRAFRRRVLCLLRAIGNRLVLKIRQPHSLAIEFG